jgi:hypothetical protein
MYSGIMLIVCEQLSGCTCSKRCSLGYIARDAV